MNLPTMIRRLPNKGDTIVEVMIATAVISSVLAGAFSVTQKSTHAVRDSQERSEMLQIVQGQVELVRAKALNAQSTADQIYTTPAFCINQTTTAVQPITDLNNYPNLCKGLGRGGLYSVIIRYIPADKAFKVQGNWDGLSGARNTVALNYRISPGGNTAP